MTYGGLIAFVTSSAAVAIYIAVDPYLFIADIDAIQWGLVIIGYFRGINSMQHTVLQQTANIEMM